MVAIGAFGQEDDLKRDIEKQYAGLTPGTPPSSRPRPPVANRQLRNNHGAGSESPLQTRAQGDESGDALEASAPQAFKLLSTKLTHMLAESTRISSLKS